MLGVNWTYPPYYVTLTSEILTKTDVLGLEKPTAIFCNISFLLLA